MTEAHLRKGLSDRLSGVARELARGSGPVKWCKTCSRKHATRAGCGLITVHVPASSGHLVKRLAHPSPGVKLP